MNREHLQEVISLLSNEPKASSTSLPLNESKDDDEQEENQFNDSVKQNLFPNENEKIFKIEFFFFKNFSNKKVIDVVEPIDYEEYVEEHRQQIDNDPLKHLLEYPKDDIDFIRIDRQYRTIIPVMPEKE